MTRHVFAWAAVHAEETRSARIDEAARQAWTITDLVLEKDIDPPVTWSEAESSPKSKWASCSP